MEMKEKLSIDSLATAMESMRKERREKHMYDYSPEVAVIVARAWAVEHGEAYVTLQRRTHDIGEGFSQVRDRLRVWETQPKIGGLRGFYPSTTEGGFILEAEGAPTSYDIGEVVRGRHGESALYRITRDMVK